MVRLLMHLAPAWVALPLIMSIAAPAAADANGGRAVFNSQCGICHSNWRS